MPIINSRLKKFYNVANAYLYHILAPVKAVIGELADSDHWFRRWLTRDFAVN